MTTAQTENHAGHEKIADVASLRARQKPLKERYSEDAAAAVVTSRASARVLGDDIAAELDTDAGTVVAGLHPATGGDGTQACSGDIVTVTKKLSEGVLDSPASCLCAAGDPSHRHRFAGDTGLSINIGGPKLQILISYPRHLALACPHIGGRDVLRRVNEISLDQLCCEPARDLF